MRRIVCLTLILLQAFCAAAQDEEILRAARYLSGASSDEELDEYWVSRLEARQGRRIRINAAQLRSDGILTDYQLASLADYRATSGDILSWAELALVDGFSAEMVEVLRPFLSLESARLPGNTDSTRIRIYTLARGTLNNVGGKARATGSWWRAGGAWRGSDGTFYAEASWRGHRLLLGDFNTRFGQGLSLWSGFSMTALSTVDAFVKPTPGISPVWSYTSDSVQRGAAYEYASAHWRGSVFGTAKALLGGHADWLGRHGQIGATLTYDLHSDPAGKLSVSLDSRWNLRGSDLAAELAWKNKAFGGLLAFRRSLGESFRIAVQTRMISSTFSGRKNGEYALSLGGSFRSGKWQALSGRKGFGSSTPEHQASLTADAALLPVPGENPRRFQLRVYGAWQWQWAAVWRLDLRLTERYRNYEASRTDLRADLRFDNNSWISVFRAEAVHCENFGFLSYLEGGYKGSETAAYVRLTGFVIDRWNDRIYCYEREAPGNFSVPAYSGRGGALSLVGSWKHRFRRCTLKAYFRASWTVRVAREPTPGLSVQLHWEY